MEEKEQEKQQHLRNFINKKEEIVGTTIQELKLQKSYKHPSIRALLPSHCLYLPPTTRKVAIMTGGSSGHEPAPLSYISPYCLNTAIVGGVFSTPSVSDIINAIYHTGKDSSGIIMIVNNYQGNSLSFGLAKMKVESAGDQFWDGEKSTPLEVIKVADDCSFIDFKASDSFGYLGETWRNKARGLTGVVFVYKVLGYWSEAWVKDETALERYKKFKNLKFEDEFDHIEELKFLSEEMMKEGGLITLASCLSSCSRFTEEDIDTSRFGDVDIGVGIHGFNGKTRLEFENTKQVANLMVRHIKNAIEATNPTGLIKKRYAVMINNLGSVTDIEMAIIAESVKDYLKMYGFNIDYISVGKFLTSLDTNGFSITVLQLKKDIKEILIEALHKETDTPFHIRPFPVVVNIEDDLESESEIEHYKKMEVKAIEDKLGVKCHRKLGKILRKVMKFLKKNREYLDKTDRQTGDGDLGMSVADAVTEILPWVDYFACDDKNLVEGLLEFSDLIAQKMKGTSGPLYSAFIYGIAESLGKSEELNQSTLRIALRVGIEKVKNLGKAEYDERTMLYVLHRIEKNWDFEVFNEEKVKKFEEEVNQYCVEVQDILPSKGMSRFIGERCLGMPDPGCEMVKLWVIKLANLLLKEFNSG